MNMYILELLRCESSSSLQRRRGYRTSHIIAAVSSSWLASSCPSSFLTCPTSILLLGIGIGGLKKGKGVDSLETLRFARAAKN